MSYAQNLGDAITPIAIEPIVNIAATGVGTAVNLNGVATANPSAATNYDGQIAFLLDSNNLAGSSPTLAIKLTHCATSGGSYTDVTGGAFTGLTTGRSQQKVVVDRSALKQFLKVSYTLGGTSSPTYDISIVACAQKKVVA